MGILWLIIKIILFLLLALLGLILFVLLVVLISPISYEAYLEKYDELIYDIKFTYLGVIRGHFCLEDGYKNHEIKAFSKVLYEEKCLEKEQIPKEEVVKSEIKKDKPHQKVKKVPTKQQPIKRQKVKVEGEDYYLVKAQDKVKDIETPVIEEIKETTEETMEEIKGETKSFVKNLDVHKIKEILFLKDFWQLIKEILYFLKDIIKYVLPRHWSYELVIGKEDPADTGEIIAKLTMLYPLYYKHGIIRGDFQRSGIWGGFLAKGRFSLLGILRRIGSFLLKPIVRKYMQLILRIRKEEKDGE